ncbi:Uncharacterised protein [uncultured archaeon]|nr:Uncharacterised protein [uncultured archaeon]
MNERVKLLRAGFTGKEIEALYVMLNGFEIVCVNWHEPAAPGTDYLYFAAKL